VAGLGARNRTHRVADGVKSCRVRVTGVVQGVGFRPHVFNLADRLGLAGWVRNDSAGVDIRIEGPEAALPAFLRDLERRAPPLARVDQVQVEERPPSGLRGFEIVASRSREEGLLPVLPEVATCADCLREMWDPSDRRHRYPFVNCTNCGPRFTIVRDVPYDRPFTTMASFPLCDACAREYDDPTDRRFHAQPIACPACGPQLSFEVAGRITAERDAALQRARHVLREGGVLAVKGLGGYHLACDATREGSVARLRSRKVREEKPFALMAADVDTVARHAIVSEAAARVLDGPERPVVLLPRRVPSSIAPAVAPGRDRLGFMLAYTPLHHLLLERDAGFPEVLVMTSGNRSDEPIAYEDDDARQRLAGIADAFLLHDRPIHVRTDDSVVGTFRERAYPVRRARGYAPLPIRLPFPVPPLVAAGGDLKNTFCLAREDHAFVGHHVGDLAYAKNVEAFEEGVRHFERLFRVEPGLVAHDLHPDYQSTRYALRRAEEEGLSTVGVQHHHAHVAAGMTDHGLPEDARVIGVAFDGTGYGLDGAIWGGEFLVAGYRDFERPMHLSYVPLPGGDAAIRTPWRSALSWLRAAGVAWTEDLPPVEAASPTERDVVERQITQHLNAPPTSSMGRLFDAVASLIGIRHRIRYEGQAACELEAVAADDEDAYSFSVGTGEVDAAPVIRDIADDVRRGVPAPVVSARFHAALAAVVEAACGHLGEKYGLRTVVLSGGVFQNLRLLGLAVERLEASGFEVLVHRAVPANDGGLALGQAVVAAARSRAEEQAVGAARSQARPPEG
jgi:hydrogenase maturation protein HypF